ncbi:MAG TPA: hypothetical protein V6C57_09270, partial [Coleofasciculaceae cyanobacterium]
MTTYPSSSLSPAPALTDEATLEATLECLLDHLPLVAEDSSCSAETLFEILLRAASRHDSIEHTAQRLDGVPSGNGIRYHLDKLDDIGMLEGQLNGALQSR